MARQKNSRGESIRLKAIGIILIFFGIMNIAGSVIQNQINYFSIHGSDMTANEPVVHHAAIYVALLSIKTVISIFTNIIIILFGALLYTDAVIPVFRALTNW